MIPNTENLPQTLTDSSRSNEIRSGLLIVASFIAFIGLLFAAGNFTLHSNVKEIPIYFNYIGGLEKNAPVQFGGHRVGKVSKVAYVQDKGKILVVASISKEVELKKDSEALIDILGFIGEKIVEISPGSPDAEILPAGEPIRGTDPVSLMKLMNSSAELAGGLGGVVQENSPAFNEITLNLRDASQNLKEMSDDLKRHPWKLIRKSEGNKKRFVVF